MSKQFVSGFSSRAKEYAASLSYASSTSRKEILNSVNQSNVNQRIVMEDETESYTTLLHAALLLGDKFMCERILVIRGLNLEAQNSEGKTVGQLAESLLKLEESGGEKNRAIEVFLKTSKVVEDKKSGGGFFGRIFGW